MSILTKITGNISPTAISRPADAAQHLVWRHPDKQFIIGSRLIVNEWEEALFFRSGEALDLFGPGGHELVTENMPIATGIFSKVFSDTNVFPCEVFFYACSHSTEGNEQPPRQLWSTHQQEQQKHSNI
jgi:membrane protease subunit (stomatin/prohibitin family)